MTPALAIRPVLAVLLTLSTAGCGMVESDPHRFERLARQVAAIPLDGREAAPPVRSAAEDGLRPAHGAPLRVEVVTPHALWDARDGGLRGAFADQLPAMAEAAAPVVMRAVAARTAPASAGSGAQPPRRLVQLGAFASREAAQAAWTRLQASPARAHLEGLQPVFEPVEVDGRRLVRLKAPAPANGAAAICAAARIDDPWCRRPA